MFKGPAPRDARKLVDDQVLRWEQGEKKRAGGEATEAWPLITVSRECGALGTATGEEVARKLGFSFWDQEIVHTIAEQTGIQEALLASLQQWCRDAESSGIKALQDFALGLRRYYPMAN